jgi:hypothetical protein
VKQLQVVIVDLQEELNRLWDLLPIDTVIASILDPRTKWFPRIPANEIKEALSVLKKVDYYYYYYIYFFFLLLLLLSSSSLLLPFLLLFILSVFSHSKGVPGISSTTTE